MFQHHCCCHSYSYQWPHRGLRSLGLPQACLFSFSFWVQEARNLDPPALPAAAASSASCPLWSCSIFFIFFKFHFKTQNSKKFRNPKDSVATQSLKVFSSSTHCWLMLCFLSYYQQKRHLDIAVVNVHLLYHTTFLLAKYSKTTVIWVVFGIKVV